MHCTCLCKIYFIQIYFLGTNSMPHIPNDNQTIIQKDLINKTLAKIRHVLSIQDNKQKYAQLTQFPQLINSIDSNLLDQPQEFIEDYLYQIAILVGINKDDSRTKLVETLTISILKAIVDIFANRTKDVSSLEFIFKIFTKQGVTIFSKSKIISWMSNREYNDFYHQCVSIIMKELSLYPKLVWQIEVKQILKLATFINSIQPSPYHTKEGVDLTENIAAELNAFFKSGRPELVKFAKFKDLNNLRQALCKKRERPSCKKIALLLLNFGETLLRAHTLQQNKAGLALIQAQISHISPFDKSILEEDDLIQWFNRNSIYQYLFNQHNLCSEALQNYQSLTRFINKCKKNHQKTRMLLNLLSNNQNDQLTKLIYKQLDGYFLEFNQRQMIYEYFSAFTDFTKVHPQFFELIRELLGRSEKDQFIEKVFNLSVRIIRQAFQQWSDSYQRKCMNEFSKIFSKYVNMCKNRTTQIKQKIIKQKLTEFLSQVSFTNIVLFNAIFNEEQMWKLLSNTPFQTVLTEVTQSVGFFDKLFQALDTKITSKSAEKQFIRIIRFISNKIHSKNDTTFKYIQILSRFPQVFEELLQNTSYSQLEEQMKKVIKIFKQCPSTPFHIFTLTFQKVNHSQFSSYNQHVGILSEKTVKNLTTSPKNLKFYEAIFQLMLQTTDNKLRSTICSYIYSLYINYRHPKSYIKNSYVNPQETFLTFLTEVLQNFVSDYEQFLNNPSTKNQICADLQLIEKSLQFTDILGCGDYKPHKSLVSTSTIYLKIANNVTFGDDVVKHLQRDFPSSMTLFDALTTIGLSFKCGPEEIVLKQNGRFISPIFNSFSLQDLDLTNHEIIAEPNRANYLQAAELFQNKSKELRPEIVNIITDIFNRFAFQGKMSIMQCTNYVRRVSGSQCLSSDRRVKDIFQFDFDNDGIILLPDFLAYYRKNLGYSSYYKQQILKGFYNLRYRKNLTLYNEPLNISQQYYLMARFKINKTYPNIYNILFRLSAHHDENLSNKAKQILLLLPSCLQIKNSILQQINFLQSTEFQIYYKLIFIENQLNTRDGQQSMAESKKKKIDLFVKNKNNQTIFMLISKYHNKPRTQYEEKSLSICLRILRSLINIEYLAKANLHQTKFDQIFIPLLPANTYFAEQTIVAFNSRNLINFQTLLVLQLTQNSVDLLSIIKYCFSQQEQIRKIACNFIYLCSLKTKFAFNLFDITISQQRNEEWFQLLCIIIQQSSQTNFQTLKNRCFSILLSRQQNFHNSYDHLMNGYLKILLAISKKQKIDVQNAQQIFTRLLNNTLQPKNRTLIFDLIRNIKREVGYNYFNEMLTRIVPSQECQIRKRYLGIKNLGAICYINSILQQFFMIDKFKYMILNRNIPKDCKETQVNGKIIVDDFFYQLQKLYHYLQYSQKRYIIPKEFCFSYKDFDGKPINTSIQQDAHQFLNRLVQNAEQAFKKQGKLQQFADILTIKKLTEISCQKCGNRIDKIENDYCLTLQVKDHNSLIDSLKKFTQNEEISDYFCEKCNRKVNKISKKTYLNQLPEIAILNLQRIIYDQHKGDKVKVHSQLSFPLAINFQDFIKNDKKTIHTEYNLKGVVIHTGTSQGGHYYSLIKTKRYGWLKFNDQSVTEFDEKDIQRQSFGGFEAKDGQEITYSTNAYILFYQRNQLPPQQFLEVQNEFTAQIQVQNKSLISQYQVHQQSFFNAIISYYNAIRYPNIEQLIKQRSFLQEHLDNSRRAQYMAILKIIKKAFSFLTIYSSIAPATRTQIVKIFCQLIFILPEETLQVLKECNINTYIENLISNSTMNERQALKQVICYMIIVYSRYYKLHLAIKTQDQTFILGIIKTIHSYMQSLHFYNNIGKLQSYFNLMHILMKNLECVTHYLLQNHYFFQLLDLIMGKDSSYTKYRPFTQDIHTNCLPIIYESINYLITFKINLKGTKIFEQSLFKTITSEAAILTNPSFYRRIIRKKYQHPLLTNLIHHYSVNDLDYSAVIAQFLIFNLNNRDQIGDIRVLFSFIKSFLQINDNLCFVRYSWIIGIPQYKDIGIRDYCLQYSDRTEYLKYISGINYKKTVHFDQRKPLLEIAKDNINKIVSIYSIEIIVSIALLSQTAFEYLLSIPPPSYIYRSYFDWMPKYVQSMQKDADFIIQNKQQCFNFINNQLQIILSQVKINTTLPAQRHIIGKTKLFQTIQNIDQKPYGIKLQKMITYVLQNRPTGQENQSMPRKYFSSHNDLNGIGHAFIRSRSKLYFQNQAKEVKTAPTIYVLSGDTKQKLILFFKGGLKNYCIILNEGSFSINFPYQKQGQILSLVDIQLYTDYKIEVASQEITKIFNIQQKKEAMEQEKEVSNPANSINEFSEPTIKCKICTFDNMIDRYSCEVCESLLYQN